MDDAKQFDQLTVSLKIDLDDGKVTVEELRLVQTHLTDLLALMLQETEGE